MTLTMVLGCATLAGCLPAVLGPSGQPLTDTQIEELVERYYSKGDTVNVVKCGWTHGVDRWGHQEIGVHEGRCLLPAGESRRVLEPMRGVADSEATPDSVIGHRTVAVGAYYDQRPGRSKTFYLKAYHPRRCRVERAKRDELGHLKCWTEHV